MADKKILDEEILSDDDLDNVSGGRHCDGGWKPDGKVFIYEEDEEWIRDAINNPFLADSRVEVYKKLLAEIEAKKQQEQDRQAAFNFILSQPEVKSFLNDVWDRMNGR